MTIDVNLLQTDETFFEELDEIMEDTMVQMFILHPDTPEALDAVKTSAASCGPLFYSAPLELHTHSDENCVAFSIQSLQALQKFPTSGRALIIDEALLDETMRAALLATNSRGIILNATAPHDDLNNFFVAIGPNTIHAFDAETLGALSMDRIVLQSHYPDHGFDEIYEEVVKNVSNAMFRPEQSIIARATKNSLELLGFKK